MLMKNVPQGNVVPSQRAAAVPTPQRARPPMADPKATRPICTRSRTVLCPLDLEVRPARRRRTGARNGAPPLRCTHPTCGLYRRRPWQRAGIMPCDQGTVALDFGINTDPGPEATRSSPMDASAATAQAPAKDPHLPPMFRIGDVIAPKAPQDIAGAQVEEGILTDLAVKLAYTAARVNTKWVGQQLHLSMSLAALVMEQACRDGLAEETMQTSQGLSHYRITTRGREHAARVLEVCGYIGPAPVRLEAYGAMLRWQFANSPPVTPEHITAALSGLVLSPKTAQLAGLAASSGRSLFVFGPPGNGKSSLGRMIHAALPGDYWIPYCISVGNSVIRLFDEQTHQTVNVVSERPGMIDQRWVR